MEASKYYALIAMKRNFAIQSEFGSMERFINVIDPQREVVKWARLFDSETGELILSWDSSNELPKQKSL